MSSALALTREVAQLLDRDRVMASQLKQELGTARLLEILEIVPREEVTKEAVESVDKLETEAMLEHVVDTLDLADVLAAYRKAGKA